MAEILTVFWSLVPVTLSQSLLYAFVALGVMIPFRLLNFPDLTCEGVFPLGAGVCAALIVMDVSPYLAFIVAVAGGFVSGCATALIHLKFRVNTLLAGILMISILWSVDLRVLGKSNVAIFGKPNVFDTLWPGFSQDVPAQIVFWLAAGVVTVLVAIWFLRTERGLGARAVGANQAIAEAQGVNTFVVTIVGLGIANALTAGAGAAMAQMQGYADVGMGFGILINGLAALIIGEAIVGRSTIPRQVLAPFAGSIVYYQLVSLGLAIGVHPADLRMVTALFVLGTLALPYARRKGSAAEPPLRA